MVANLCNCQALSLRGAGGDSFFILETSVDVNRCPANSALQTPPALPSHSHSSTPSPLQQTPPFVHLHHYQATPTPALPAPSCKPRPSISLRPLPLSLSLHHHASGLFLCLRSIRFLATAFTFTYCIQKCLCS